MESMQGSTDNILQKRLLKRVNEMKINSLNDKLNNDKLNNKNDKNYNKNEDENYNTNNNKIDDMNNDKNNDMNNDKMESYEEFLKLRFNEGLSEMDIRKIYCFYCKEVSNGRVCVLNANKYIQDLHHRSDLAGYEDQSILDFIQYGQKYNEDYKILSGITLNEIESIDNTYQILDVCDISPEYKNKNINIRLKCFIITLYKPYDKEELEKYRSKLKSIYCKCPTKRCIRTIKDIQKPKTPFTISIFRNLNIDETYMKKYIQKSIDNLNTTYLNKYFDAVTSYERKILTKNIYYNLDLLETNEINNSIDSTDEYKKEIINNFINQMNIILLNDNIENISISFNNQLDDEISYY